MPLNDTARPPLAPAAVGAASVIAGVTIAWRFVTFTGFSNDHYGHLALAQQMLLGDRPIRDFSDPGWPLTYLISAAAWRAAGDAMVVEWWIAAAALALAAALTVVAAYRLSGSAAIAVVVTALEVLIYPRTYSYPKVLVYAAAACVMLGLAAAPTRGRILLMAGTIAVAFLFRHDHGLYVGAAAVACLLLASRADGWRIGIRRTAFLAAATAGVLLPWMLFVSLNGGLVPYFASALEFARTEAAASNLRSRPMFSRVPGERILGVARPSRPLAQVQWADGTAESVREALEARYGLERVLATDEAQIYYVRDPSPANLRALSRDPHVAGTSGLGRVARPWWRELAATLSPLRLAPALHSAPNADAWLYWLFWVLPAMCAALVAARLARRRERWPGETALVAGLVVAAVLVNNGFLRDILRTRIADAVVPAALLGAWLLGLCWIGRWRRAGWQRAVQVATIAVLIVTTAAMTTVAETRQQLARIRLDDGLTGVRARAAAVSRLLARPHRQTLAPPSRYSEALMPFYAYLDRCTSPAERLIVVGEFPDVPVLAGRRFASDGVVIAGGYSSAARQDDTLARIRTNPPLFVLILSDERTFHERFQTIARYVDEAFEPMTDVEVPGAGVAPIRVNRHREASGRDVETGWPCFVRR